MAGSGGEMGHWRLRNFNSLKVTKEAGEETHCTVMIWTQKPQNEMGGNTGDHVIAGEVGWKADRNLLLSLWNLLQI